MDRALKERIIGAIVLVVVVVLVVPVFLDGPPKDGDVVSERISLPGQEANGARTDGTRTVVLDRDRSEPVPEEQSPAAGQTTAAPAVDAAPAPATREEPAASRPEQAAAVRPPAPDAAADEPEPAPASSVQQAAEPRTRSSTGMWAVQLGSFSNEANAERLAADLRQQGFAAFLSKLATGNGELHRVRVGPQRDRESAETMLARLERAGQKGQVVPHP